ncbi:MAG: 3-phosphoshikimate 1-carboxyvinyltransferase, partial [Gemmatimonadaceae bacterium]|nr:3-phosphoshikimate 1-carboxyvinyltransferase [Gemmatimonadaceae bacterium]
LLAGVIAASPMSATFVGDASLTRRPMRRVARPLEALGARVELSASGGLPMAVHGARLRGTTWHSEVASAQVKSAILLAAVIADVPVEVHEPLSTRDHTERMLQARGIDLRVDGNVVALVPGRALGAADVEVPADPSSAFFLAARAACDPSHPVLLTDVCLNPHRIGAFRVLRRMGAEVHFERVREAGGEPVGDVRVATGTLRSAVIEAEEIPSLVDELPMLAALASRGTGTLEVRGAGELRVKESDRIATVVANLRAVGARAEEQPDGFVVEGSSAALSGAVVTQGDHRIAMAFGVLGSLPGHAITVDDRACADVSFPGFWECMEAMRE